MFRLFKYQNLGFLLLLEFVSVRLHESLWAVFAAGDHSEQKAFEWTISIHN